MKYMMMCPTLISYLINTLGIQFQIKLQGERYNASTLMNVMDHKSRMSLFLISSPVRASSPPSFPWQFMR